MAKIVANTVADLILPPAQDQVPSPTKLSMMRRNLVTWPQFAEAAMTLIWLSSFGGNAETGGTFCAWRNEAVKDRGCVEYPSGLQGVDGKGKSASERGHGLTRLVDSVRVPKGLAAGLFSRTL